MAVHRFVIDAVDLPGNSASALGETRIITLTLDGAAPPTPSWTSSGGKVIQALGSLEGRCEELAVKVILYEDVQYYLMIGTVKQTRQSRALSVFRKTAKTFKREKPEKK